MNLLFSKRALRLGFMRSRINKYHSKSFLHCIALLWLFNCCSTTVKIPPRNPEAMGGEEFYRLARTLDWRERDSLAQHEILAGNMPSFLRDYVKVSTIVVDSVNSKTIQAIYYVTADYLSIGSDRDWARVPLTPMAAQVIADSFDCFLPTRKMVDDIYSASQIKLRPVPMYAIRDSAITMWHHHLIIEGQRQSKRGLISGIKKDVVISEKILHHPRPDRVAIYGWHRLDGTPIQPLYSGHINWHVDYSHGIRLVYRKIKVDGEWMDYTEVLNHEVLRGLLCDEVDCNFRRY